MRPVAADQPIAFYNVGGIAFGQGGTNAAFVLREPVQPGAPFDLVTQIGQLLDQKLFMDVLGQHEKVGIWTQALSHVQQRKLGLLCATVHKMDRLHRYADIDDLIGEPHNAVEFQRPCLNAHRPRLVGRSGLGTHDPKRNANTRKREGHHQSRGTGPRDEDLIVDGHPVSLP